MAYDGIRDLVTNFVWRGLDRPDMVWVAHTRVTLPYGLRGEEEVARSKRRANRFTVGSHERKCERALQLAVMVYIGLCQQCTISRHILLPNSWIVNSYSIII